MYCASRFVRTWPTRAGSPLVRIRAVMLFADSAIPPQTVLARFGCPRTTALAKQSRLSPAQPVSSLRSGTGMKLRFNLRTTNSVHVASRSKALRQGQLVPLLLHCRPADAVRKAIRWSSECGPVTKRAFIEEALHAVMQPLRRQRAGTGPLNDRHHG